MAEDGCPGVLLSAAIGGCRRVAGGDALEAGESHVHVAATLEHLEGNALFIADGLDALEAGPVGLDVAGLAERGSDELVARPRRDDLAREVVPRGSPVDLGVRPKLGRYEKLRQELLASGDLVQGGDGGRLVKTVSSRRPAVRMTLCLAARTTGESNGRTPISRR